MPRKYFTLLSISVLFLLASCSPDKAINIEDTDSATQIFISPTVTEIPPLIETEMATPTPILTATVTPTLDLPIQNNTPFPEVSTILTLDNIDEIEEIARYSGSLNAVARVSKDQKYMVTASSTGVDVYDLENDALINHFDMYIPYVYMQRLGGGGIGNYYEKYNLEIDKTANLIMITNNENVNVLTREGELYYQYTIAADMCDLEMHWADLYPLTRGVSSTMSSDGTLLAINECNSEFEIVNIENNTIIYQWDHKNLSMHGRPLGFSPDGKLLTILYDSRLWVWNIETNENVAKIAYKKSAGNEFDWAFSPNSQLMAVAQENKIKIWSFEKNKFVREILSDNNFQYIGDNPEIKFSQNSDYLGVHFAAYEIEVWDIALGTLLSTKNTGGICISCIQILENGNIEFYNISKKTYDLWAEYSWNLGNFGFLEDSSGIVFQGENRWLGKNCQINILKNIKCLTNYRENINQENYFFWDGTKYLFATREKTTISVFDNEMPLVSFPIKGNDYFNPIRINKISNLIFYSETIYFSFGSEDKFYIRDINKNKLIREWDGFSSQVEFSPDNKLAAFFVTLSKGKEKLFLFDMENKRILNNNMPYLWTSGTTSFGFSPDSKQLAYAANTYEDLQTRIGYRRTPIYIIDTDNYKNSTRHEIAISLLDKNTWITSLKYSPAGDFIAFSDSGGSVSILNPNNGEIVYGWETIFKSFSSLTNIAISPDGRFITTAAESGVISIWGIMP